MKILKSIFQKIKYNGVKPYELSPDKRLVIYKNLIWMYSYAAFTIGTLMVHFFAEPGAAYWQIVAGFHLLFWFDYFITAKGLFYVSRHFFIVLVYSFFFLMCYLFGRESYSFLHFLAFLPTAFNLFSFKQSRFATIFYTALIPVILILCELFLYNKVVIQPWALEVQRTTTFINIVFSVILTAIYSGYVIHKVGIRQNQLIALSNSLQTTLNNTSGPIWSINRDYELIVFNKQFEQFISKHYDIPNAKVGLSLLPFLYHSNMNQRFRNIYINVLLGKSVIEELDFYEYTFELRAEPLFDENLKAIGATFSARNITEIKNAQNILIRAKQEAELHAHSRTVLLSNMSHELRTPLNGINGVIKTIQEEQDLEAIKENMGILDSLSNHMIGLINNILDFNKLSVGKVTLDIVRFNLAGLLNGLKPLFAGLAKNKQIDFVLTCNSRVDLFVKGDEIKLKQVLINLVGNAIKFTDYGSVKLIVDVVEDDTSCTARFNVLDTGIGIPQASVAKIFESFTQADAKTTRKYGGSGLGLNIASGLLEVMQSGMMVESEVGKGSSFSFVLKFPKSSSNSPSATKTAIDNTPLEPLPNAKVLLAEDNKINQMVAKRMLDLWKVKVGVANNGKEAVQLVQRESYDVILMDLDMPELDGYGATDAIRALKMTTPIVALTAASFENMLEVLHSKGFDDVLQKPFMPQDLHATILRSTQKVVS